jgi:uncharacterized protein
MVRDLVEYLAQKVVDDPSAVRVEAVGEREVTYLIHVANGEEGRVIGKGGRVIRCRTSRARASRSGRSPRRWSWRVQSRVRIQVEPEAPRERGFLLSRTG